LAYSKLSQVKERLPGVAGSTWDTELTGCQAYAYDFINEKLRPYVNVPLTDPPGLLAQIEADLAAGLFQARRPPKEEGEAKIAAAVARLNDFIQARYLSGSSFSRVKP